jgi:hypothetical protein
MHAYQKINKRTSFVKYCRAVRQTMKIFRKQPSTVCAAQSRWNRLQNDQG